MCKNLERTTLENGSFQKSIYANETCISAQKISLFAKFDATQEPPKRTGTKVSHLLLTALGTWCCIQQKTMDRTVRTVVVVDDEGNKKPKMVY